MSKHADLIHSLQNMDALSVEFVQACSMAATTIVEQEKQIKQLKKQQGLSSSGVVRGAKYRDATGVIKVMAVADGYVMARRSGCMPGVTPEKEFLSKCVLVEGK